MRVYPKKTGIVKEEKPQKDTSMIQKVALIFAFISVFGIAVKLIFL